MRTVIITSIAAALTLSTAALASIIPDDIKAAARQHVDNGDTPALAIGVIADNKQEFFFVGRRSSDDDGPINEDTVFEIGSITKVFTAILLADAVERGVVGLDDPVQNLLPNGVQVPQRDGKSITLLDLANHRSALPRIPSNIIPDPRNPYAPYTADMMYAFLKDYSLPRDIGGQYEYSNLAFGLLGHALSLQAERSYEDLVLDRICKPLGLKSTRISLTRRMTKRLAHGHTRSIDTPVPNWDFDCLAGCGAIRSTAGDMLKFLAASMELNEGPLQAAMKRAQTGRHAAGPGMAVALGWHVLDRHGVEVIWHNGGTGGYHSFCGFDRENKRAIVVLANSTLDIDDLGLHFLAKDYELKKIHRTVELAAEKLDDYLGFYEMQAGRVFEVTKREKKLFVKLSGQESIQVYPTADDKFYYKVVDAQISFGRDEAGSVTTLTLHQNGRDLLAPKMPADFKPAQRKEVSVDLGILSGYVGKYQLNPAIIIEVRLLGDALTVQLTGQPAIPVYAESKTKFFYKVVEAQITFVSDGEGEAISLTLHQAGVDQSAKRMD